MKRIITLILIIISTNIASAQFTYGTTGLLNMPTADMQKDKTFMFGGAFLEKHATSGRWFYNTLQYYINITIFPWMEFSYSCPLHKAVKKDPALAGGYWLSDTYGKFVNQDRNFHIRLRLWKEGWLRWWTPQIVIGGDDALNNSWGKGDKLSPSTEKANGFNNRYYLAVTKHFHFIDIGEIGAHLTWVYNERPDYKLNALCVGTNFRFKLREDNSLLNKIINGLNLMLEAYPADGQGMFYKAQLEGKDYKTYDRGIHIGIHDINIGACYSFWKDHINLYGELYGCKDFSGGLQFKIPLK